MFGRVGHVGLSFVASTVVADALDAVLIAATSALAFNTCPIAGAKGVTATAAFSYIAGPLLVFVDEILVIRRSIGVAHFAFAIVIAALTHRAEFIATTAASFAIANPIA